MEGYNTHNVLDDDDDYGKVYPLAARILYYDDYDYLPSGHRLRG